MRNALSRYLEYEFAPGPLTVQDIKAMHGANYFSGGPVVVMRLDLGRYDEVFSSQIEGFPERLAGAVPSLEEHHCSEGMPGGFLLRVREGTLLGHVTEHVAIELQTLAGMDVSYGKTRRTTTPGVYNVVFRFLDEVAGIYAGKAAVNLINALLEDRPFDVRQIIADLVDIREKRLLGPSTQAIADAARARGIPCLRLDEYNLVQLGTGRHQKRIRATITSDTGFLGVETADSKRLSTLMLRAAGVPVPETLATDKLSEALEFFHHRGRPVVVKPGEGQLGRGVSLDLQDDGQVRDAFAWATRFDDQVLVQEYVPGHTYRLLVVNYRFVAAAELAPPTVTGDGRRTLRELVEHLNRQPDRGVGDKARLSRVEIDELTLRLLAGRGYTPESVPHAGEAVPLKVSGSLRGGGSARDVTGEVHPFNRFLAERAAHVIGLNIAGLDVVAPTLKESLLDTGGVFIEANAAPDFRMHLRPTKGSARPVAKPVVDMLFPAGSQTRIPVFSVTGTLGKTTTVHLLAHCLRLARRQVGFTCTEGLCIGDKWLMRGDMTYPEHVATVLNDPTIDSAVLETAREGILRRGLGYEYADYGIVLNMHDDHVGSDDITYLEDLAYAKSVVAEQVYPEGCAVLNADIELVLEMKSRVSSRLALFSRSAGSAAVREHAAAGGLAVVLDGGDIVVRRDDEAVRVMALADAPLTHGGRALQNTDNILAAVAALHAFGMPVESIRYGLKSFYPDPERLAGRLNLMPVRDFQVLLDYAHNPVGYEGLRDFLRHFKEKKIGVIDAAGDRPDEAIQTMGALAARTYDELYLYEGIDRRGRKEGEIVGLLEKGARGAGMRARKIHRLLDPEEAWRAGLTRGAAGTLVVILSGRPEKTLAVIRDFASAQ